MSVSILLARSVFKEALLANDIDYILGQAIEQIHAGADILDVNVGLRESTKEYDGQGCKSLQALSMCLCRWIQLYLRCLKPL